MDRAMDGYLEILVCLRTLRNIDLFQKGMYRVRVSLNARPTPLGSSYDPLASSVDDVVVKLASTLNCAPRSSVDGSVISDSKALSVPAQIDELHRHGTVARVLSSRAVHVRYRNEAFEIDDAVRFRIPVALARADRAAPIALDFDLLYASVDFDVRRASRASSAGPAAMQNASSSSLGGGGENENFAFEVVATRTLQIPADFACEGVHEFHPIVWDRAHFGGLDATLHTVLRRQSRPVQKSTESSVGRQDRRRLRGGAARGAEEVGGSESGSESESEGVDTDGETRRERIESLLLLRESHQKYGHLQEIIIQNFRAKEGTKMVAAPEPDLNELLWTIAVARLIFGSEMSIQAPPNLSPGVLPKIISAGINDWGGISPVTPDFVNPEAPWPHLDNLAVETASAEKYLQERLTIYPSFAINGNDWLDEKLQTPILRMIDAEGFPRVDHWSPGDSIAPPAGIIGLLNKTSLASVSLDVVSIVERARRGEELAETEIVRLFQSRGDDMAYVCQAADQRRKDCNGDEVSFVVNRNINYTNICYFKCQFCAFSKGKLSENLRGRPYDLGHEEITRRCEEAWQRGATEVCMQGGIHPEYTGDTYIDIVKAVKLATPEMHVHAFSPLEVWQGAATLGIGVDEFLLRLKAAGLNTLPGTAAEILDDEVRADLCHDKINTAQWLEVMEAAHNAGFNTTATIMYGHIEKLQHWARHLLRVRQLQEKTGGFTEFVPLPFVHMEAPLYLKGKSRSGPTFRESLLMHAVARLVLSPLIKNIQTSWVKMGEQGVVACLRSGANDLGGTLMNESITRAAGAEHGEEYSVEKMIRLIDLAGRQARQRSTDYQGVTQERMHAARHAKPLTDVITAVEKKYDRKSVQKTPLIVNG